MNDWKHFTTVYAYDVNKTVDALIDNGIDPCAIKTEDGPEPGTVKISVLRTEEDSQAPGAPTLYRR